MSEQTPTTGNTLSVATAQPLDQNAAALYLSNLAPTGRRTQHQALNTVAGMLSGGTLTALELDWSRVRYAHVAAVRSRLIETYKPATVNKFLAALRGALKSAWRLGQLSAEDYQRAVDIQSVNGSTLPRGRELTTGEVRALLAACEADRSPVGARDAAILALMFGAGLRRAEIVRLDLADIEQGTGRLVIHGKRSKERSAFLTNGAALAVADWLELRGEEPGPLFWAVLKSGRLVNRRLSNQTVYDLLAKRADQAEVRDLSPHDARRTFISNLLENGVDLALVSRLVGHENLSTTARYDRRGEDQKKRAAETVHVPYHGRG